MKKNLLWSFIAATAMLTACTDNAIVDDGNQQQLTGKEVPVAFAVNIGNPIETYASPTIWSELGGWTNFQRNSEILAKAGWQARAYLKVYQGENTLPLAKAETTIVPTEGNTTIQFENLDLTPGATYKAFVWVGFENTKTPTAFYSVADNGEVTIANTTKDAQIDLSGNFAEMRDAYTQVVNFTLSADGKYTNVGTGGTGNSSTTLTITARRVLSKLRIIMTDAQGQAGWKAFFKEESNKGRILDFVSLQMAGQTTTYNPFANERQFSGNVAGQQIYHTFNSDVKAGEAAWEPGNFKWVNAQYKSVDADANDALYPVIDVNYFFPIAAGASITPKLFAMNGMKVDGTADAAPNTLADALGAKAISVESTLGESDQIWRCLFYKTFSAIPLEKNCLTTIVGNFLTKSVGFNVIVNDAFDNVISDNVVTVNEDGTVTKTTAFGTKGTLVTVTYENATATAKVTAVDVQKMTTDNQGEVMTFIDEVVGENHESVALSLNTDANSNITVDISGKIYKSIALKSVNNKKYSVDFKGNTTQMTVDSSVGESVTVENAAPEGELIANLTTISSNGVFNVTGVNVIINGVNKTSKQAYAGQLNIEANSTTINDEAGKSMFNAKVNFLNGKGVSGSTLTFADEKAKFNNLESDVETITFNGENYSENDSKMKLTGDEKTQTLVILGSPTCKPTNENITVNNQQWIDTTGDTGNVWSSLPTNLVKVEED